MVGAVAVAGLTVLLAWLVAEHPTLGGIVAAVCLVLLALAIFQVLRDESPALRAGSMALALLAGAFVIVFIDSPGEETSTAAASATTPTAELVADPVDCACPPSSDLVGIGLAAGNRASVQVAMAAAPVDGTELFVWRVAAPAGPLHLRRVDGDWRAVTDPWNSNATVTEHGRTVTVRAAVDEPVAVVSDGGDRAPDVGHVTSDGEVLASGTHASTVERAVVTAQSGYASLDPAQQALAASLLSRQYGSGTIRYRGTAPGSTTPSEVTLIVEYPELAQLTGSTGDGVYALADRIVTCSAAAGGGPPTCRASEIAVPATAAAAMVADRARVTVRAAPDLERSGSRCVRVESDLASGPIPGSACWRPDGLLVSSVRPDGFTLELIDVRAEVDPGRLQAPG